MRGVYVSRMEEADLRGVCEAVVVDESTSSHPSREIQFWHCQAEWCSVGAIPGDKKGYGK